LFTQPANLLVMDEPTNDLDAETLELLEELLMGYSGTLLLVSHDRSFLNNVITSCIVFDDDGQLREYVGGYDDWQRQRQQDLATKTANKKPEAKAVAAKKPEKKKSALTYQESLDLKALPAEIEKMEEQQQQLNEQMSEADFYKGSQAEIDQVQQQSAALAEKLEQAYARWEALEEKQNQS
jgi:ATP-binding cassette subfamily F protein uup